MTVLVPLLLLLANGSNVGWGLADGLAVLPVLLGVAMIAAGFALWLWTVWLFALVGRGTLAPWDPTRHLVVEGPYRHVRNPMIAAVLTVLAREAALFGSPPLLVWCAAFFALNQAFFLLHEEPGLARRFGDGVPGLQAERPAMASQAHPVDPVAALVRSDNRKRVSGAQIRTPRCR